MPGKIIYKDVAPGSAEDAAYSATGQTAFSTLDLSADDASERIATLERNRWVLDGTFTLRTNPVHFWSEELSDGNCEFAVPPVITVNFDQQYTTLGINLVFDTATNEWASEVEIKWYQGATLKATETFYPDAPSYFCARTVTTYNKVVITFKKSSLPRRRIRLENIVFGITRTFGMDEIMSASAINEMDLLSAELPASQLDWTLNSKNAIDYIFQLKQPLTMMDGNNIIGVYYVMQSKRISSTIYQVTAQDAIGVLGEQFYGGGVFLSGVSAKTLLSTIVDGAFPIEYGTVSDATLYGLLVKQTKREAIQQVLFAWGKCVRTDGGNSLKVFDPPTIPVTISKANTYNGVSIETSPIVTQVNVYGHTYQQDASGNIEVLGQKYADTLTLYTVNNPDVVSGDIENVIEVTEATLVSTHNGSATANRVYNHYLRRNTHSSKVIYNGEHLGDCLRQPTPWDTQEVGNVRAISVTLSHIVAADIESLGVEE